MDVTYTLAYYNRAECTGVNGFIEQVILIIQSEVKKLFLGYFTLILVNIR
jgi:hypothetical protein